MNISPKERYLDICHFKRLGDMWLRDSLPEVTLKNWVAQGAPSEIVKNPRFCREYFQFERSSGLVEIRASSYGGGDEETVTPEIDLGCGITMRGGGGPVVPAYESRIISMDEHTVTLIDGAGRTRKSLKEDIIKGDIKTRGWSMSMYLDWQVKDRATWNEHKKRLDPNTPERWPSDWNTYVQKMNGKSEPLSLPVGGFYGELREWVGSERILYMFHDDPGLIEDMMEQMLYLETEVIKRVLKDIKVQQATFWEDMCYKAGPLISPAMVRKFMMPRYKKITDLLHSYGVDVIYL